MKKYLTILSLFLMGSSKMTVTIVKPVLAEYRSAMICSDGNLYSYINPSNGSVMVAFPLPGSRSVADGVGGFNSYLLTATDGTLWINYNDGTQNWNQYTLDSTGGTINAILPDAMGSQYVYIKPSDSSVWYGGTDTLHLLHTTGGGNYNFVKISGSLKFKKVLVGFFRVVGLTTTGQVYEWLRNSGSIVPTQMTLTGLGTGSAIDIWVSHYDYAGCIIPNVGETSGYGWPYVWGSQYGAWQGGAAYTQPTAIASTWGITTPVKQVVAGWNTTHLIDSLSHMLGLAWSQTTGELGNGIEFANRYTYSQPYSWTLNDGENPSGTPMVQIGSGTNWSKLFNNTWFTFYNMAFDASNNLYFWGADKSYVSGRGYNCLQSASYRDALDVTSPLLVNPLDSSYSAYNFTLPNISIVGGNQSISGTSGTLTQAGTPALLINNANSTDTLDYRFAGYAWTKVSGPSCTITSPSAKVTTVTGLSTGTYVFQLITTDNNGGTAETQVTWTVNITNCNCILVPAGVVIKLISAFLNRLKHEKDFDFRHPLYALLSKEPEYLPANFLQSLANAGR
jgi:hypothetical protein